MGMCQRQIVILFFFLVILHVNARHVHQKHASHPKSKELEYDIHGLGPVGEDGKPTNLAFNAGTQTQVVNALVGELGLGDVPKCSPKSHKNTIPAGRDFSTTFIHGYHGGQAWKNWIQGAGISAIETQVKAFYSAPPAKTVTKELWCPPAQPGKTTITFTVRRTQTCGELKAQK